MGEVLSEQILHPQAVFNGTIYLPFTSAASEPFFPEVVNVAEPATGTGVPIIGQGHRKGVTMGVFALNSRPPTGCRRMWLSLKRMVCALL